jgi:hypothetical protein
MSEAPHPVAEPASIADRLSVPEQLKILFATRSSAAQHFWSVFRVYGTLHSALIAFGALLATVLREGGAHSSDLVLPPRLLVLTGTVGTIVAYAWATSAARLLYHIHNKDRLIRQLELEAIPPGRRMLAATPEHDPYFRARGGVLADGLSTKMWGRCMPWLFFTGWVAVAIFGLLQLL